MRYDDVRLCLLLGLAGAGFPQSGCVAPARDQGAAAPQSEPSPSGAQGSPTPAGSPVKWSNGQWNSVFTSLLAKRGVGSTGSMEGLAAIEADLKALGATLQRDSAGNIRGRIYLPNGNPDDPYGRKVDVVNSWGNPWVWIVR